MHGTRLKYNLFCEGCARGSILVLALALATLSHAAADAVPETKLQIVRQQDTYRVQVLSGERVLLSSPPEGLWSIASDWRDGWPAEWRHAAPQHMEKSGEWTILSGRLEAPQGAWELRDAYRSLGRSVQCVRRFTWKGDVPAHRVTLSLRWQAASRQAQVLLPGIIYYGNPSGAASGRVPVYSAQRGEEAIYEEHRYPVPMATLEWADGPQWLGAALHTLPCPAPYGHLRDQWWSMGVETGSQGPELVLLSGPCASNGKRSVVKALLRGCMPYDEAYLDVPPGAVIEKTCYLEAYPVAAEGSGFRRPLWTAIDRLKPFYADDLPSYREIIEAKYRFAKSRWVETPDYAGFRKYPDKQAIAIGWSGQAEAPSYALQVLAPELGDPHAITMAYKSLDFLSTSPFSEDGFCAWYDGEKRAWQSWHDGEKRTWQMGNLLSQGQGMLTIGRAIRVGRTQGHDTAAWERFFRKACDIQAARILADGWHPDSTSEGVLIAPLAEAAGLFDNPSYRKAAIKAAEHYGARHTSMREPYWGGTLDAHCEDKEGAYAALQGFLAVYELTNDRKYLDWAAHAADVVLSYVVMWDIDLPAGRLRSLGLKTRGLSAVSPQNQHIDVFGSLIAADIYRLGQLQQRPSLCRLAEVMYRSAGQIIDPYGSQGEQLQQTNCALRGDLSDVFSFRGGYAEEWTVFWITAHFLNGAARLKEMGVALDNPAATAPPH
jgi:hypothetical protein